MPDTDDQVQNQEQTESAETPKEEVKTENQETPEEEQSKTQEVKSEEKKYKLHLMGKDVEMTADELHGWAEKVEPEFTRRSQLLSDYQKQEKERQSRATSEAQSSIRENPILKNVDPNVREAIVQIVKPEIEQSIKRLEEADSQRKADENFENEMLSLEKEFSSGSTKFNRSEVLAYMQQQGNKNFDPRSIHMDVLHKSEFMDLAIKEALKKQKGGVSTERTGTQTPQAPKGKTPRTMQEASNSFLNRLRQAS